MSVTQTGRKKKHNEITTMPPTSRSWIWSLVAVAGTAAAATLVYKYATRGTRDRRESETLATVETQESEDADYEWLSEDATDETNEDADADADADAEQQMMVVDRGTNMVRWF